MTRYERASEDDCLVFNPEPDPPFSMEGLKEALAKFAPLAEEGEKLKAAETAIFNRIMSQREKLVEAFIAETGLRPSQCELVYENMQTVFRVRQKPLFVSPFPAPEPPFLTQEHGRMMREMDAMLMPYPDSASWRVEIPEPSHLAIWRNAGEAVEDCHAAFSKAKEGQADADSR